jgi:DMSO/TMAO reductase YedYZ molybdopterin-dependent catalytic subunit
LNVWQAAEKLLPSTGSEWARPNLPLITIHIHGDVAVAYGISSEKLIDGKPHRSYFADYYVWKNGVWRVYFAQQTSFPA